MRIILAAALALGLVAALLSVAAARLGPTIQSLNTAQVLGGTSVNTEVALTFTQPMNMQSVEHSFQITPHVAGSFSWTGNSLVYVPRRALRYATSYTVTVGTSARTQGGQHLASTFHRQITTEAEHFLSIGTTGSQRNRIILTAINGQQQVLGEDNVTQLSVSADGTSAVFIRRGSAHEHPDEIWLLSLSDGSTQRLLRRPSWILQQAHLAPDGQTVAFLATNVRLCRKYYGCFRDTNSPIVEMLDARSRRVHAFHATADTPVTNFVDFSPSGQLAFTDLGSALTLSDISGSKITHVPNQGNSLEFAAFDPPGNKVVFVGQTADSTGGDILVYLGGKYLDLSRGIYDSSAPSFSATGNAVAYSAYRTEVGIEPVYGINVYNFKSHRTLHLTADRKRSDWDAQWSPDDRYIAFIRSRPQEAMYMGSGQVWVMRSDGGAAHEVMGGGRDIAWVA